MSPDDKPLVWLHGEIKTPPLSTAARLKAGFLLRALQRGDRAEAQRLYLRADRAWGEFYAGPGAASGWGPLLRSKIDARLSELD